MTSPAQSTFIVVTIFSFSMHKLQFIISLYFLAILIFSFIGPYIYRKICGAKMMNIRVITELREREGCGHRL